MKRPRAEEILGEWGVRDVTPPSSRERERLASDHELNPLAGTPLRRRLAAFQVDPDRYLAALGGPLPYMRRLRAIEEETERQRQRLAEAHEAYRGDPAGWRALAERWDFSEVNELIERHNRYYPIESRLPMDPRTRDFVLLGGHPYTRTPLDAAWVLATFPE